MALWQNILLFALFGCIVYFPVLLVECVMQRREIARLRHVLEGVVSAKKLEECREKPKRDVQEYRPIMWKVKETGGER